jgi:hypothetical protein
MEVISGKRHKSCNPAAESRRVLESLRSSHSIQEMSGETTKKTVQVKPQKCSSNHKTITSRREVIKNARILSQYSNHKSQEIGRFYQKVTPPDPVPLKNPDFFCSTCCGPRPAIWAELGATPGGGGGMLGGACPLKRAPASNFACCTGITIVTT